MQVFICSGCKMQHNTEDIEDTYVDICDACKLPFHKGANAKKYSCLTCDESGNYSDPEYHKTCVTKIEDMYYCDAHKAVKEKALEAGTIIQKYAQEFWSEIGGTIVEFKQEGGSLNRNFKVQFEALTLEVKLSAVTKGSVDEDDPDRADIVTTDEITALNHNVSGIKNYGSKTYKVGIHSHQEALQEVAEALVRSLRSKKSALTIAKKQTDVSRTRRLEYANSYPNKSKKKHLLRLQEIESDCKRSLNVVLVRRRKINKMSKFLVGKLAEFKKSREEKVESQEAVLV